MKTFLLAKVLIGCSLLFTTTAMAEQTCDNVPVNKNYTTKANTDRKNWKYWDTNNHFSKEADPSRGDIFNFSPKSGDVLQVKGTGYVQIVVKGFSGDVIICADPTAAIDLFFNLDDESKNKSGGIIVYGSDRPDLIYMGGAFTSVIHGKGGDDLLIGGRFQGDHIDGGEGNDYIEGNGGGDRLEGDSGKDLISVNIHYDDTARAIIDGGSGDDIIVGGLGDDMISGGSGKDLIMLSGNIARKDAIKNSASTSGFYIPEYFDRNNWDYVDDKEFMDSKGGEVDGEEGNDIIYGSDGDDHISGGTGDDTIKGANGNDTVYGDEGNDDIWGSSGDDDIHGGDGDDLLKGGSGNDVIGGGEGKDFIYGENGNDQLFGGDDEDTIDGGNDDDLVSGDEGLDHLYGGSGNDVITLGESRGKYVREGDTYRNTCKQDLGGCLAGNPMVAVKRTTDTHGGDVDGGSGNDDIYGTDGNNDQDYLVGGSGQDVLWGFDGTNNIHGGDNNDFLIGGPGKDDLYGDSGFDMCWGRGDAGCND